MQTRGAAGLLGLEVWGWKSGAGCWSAALVAAGGGAGTGCAATLRAVVGVLGWDAVALRVEDDEAARTDILARIDVLESTQGTGGFLAAYQSFMAIASNHITTFGFLLPCLTQMLSGGN